MEYQRKIHDLLFQLGVTANYTGFFYASYAIQLCLEEPQRLMLVTKWVYPDVAKHFNTTWKAVERNLRTTGSIVWTQGHHQLEYLAAFIFLGTCMSVSLVFYVFLPYYI